MAITRLCACDTILTSPWWRAFTLTRSLSPAGAASGRPLLRETHIGWRPTPERPLNIAVRATVVVPVTAAPAEPPFHEDYALADESALRRLYVEHGPALVNHLLRITRGDRHLAEDVVQETMLRAWRHPEAQGADGRWTRPWLFTVAQRIAIDRIRAGNTRPVEVSDEHIELHARAEDRLERLLDAREVRAAVVALPERFRNVLIEVYFRECSVAEAAVALNIPLGTVKSRTFYALRALQESLEHRGFLAGSASD